MKTTLKSIGAVLAAFVAVFALSLITDMLLSKAGFMIMDPFNNNSTGIILIVIFYRCVYNIFGSYLAAKLAPKNHMRHAIIVGSIGLALSVVATIVMWDVPPHWYPITLIIFALPCAWLGGRLYENSKKTK